MDTGRCATFRLGLAPIAVLAATLVLTGCEPEQYDPETAQADSPQADESLRQGSIGTPNAHHYSAHLHEGELPVAQQDELVVEVEPSSQTRINLEFPWALRVVEAEGLEFEETQLEADQMELTEEKARIPLDATAEEPGEYTVVTRGDFSVCNDEICPILTDERVEFTVVAE